jgi:hypothetical protein
MMGDPPRLRSQSGDLGALLIRSSRSVEPPPSAEEEVWRRLSVATAAGAAAGAALAAPTAAGSKAVASTLWVSVLKWSAILAIGFPAAGMAARWAIRHEGSAAVATSAIRSSPHPRLEDDAVQEPPAAPAQAATLGASVEPAQPAVKPGPLPSRIHGAAAALSGGVKHVPSALTKESRSLGAARAKYEAGDPRGALDAIVRLAAEVPHGELVQEREVLAMDCLATLGDTAGARARALAFLGRFPQSPYLAHVRTFVDR